MITLQKEIARELTPEEADGNIEDLDRRLRVIEELGLQAVGIADLDVDPSNQSITVLFDDNSTRGPFNLPLSAFVPRGKWSKDTIYQPRDYVSVAGSSYVCVATHIAKVFADDATAGRWMVISLKGVDGTPGAPFATYVGLYSATTAYTEGQMVFASSNGVFNLWRAVSNLPIGTAPGTLQPNGTPYWTQQSSNATAEIAAPTVSGKPAAGAVVLRRRFARSQSLLANLAGAVAGLGTPPAAAFKLSVRRNGVEFATLTWAANGAAPTLAGSGVTFAIGDVLTVVAPATQDANAADLDVTLLTYPI